MGNDPTINSGEIQIDLNEAAHRFQVEIDGQLAFLEFQRSGKRIVLVHTEVPASIGKRGLASRIVKTVLDYARTENLMVVPICPFVVTYIRKHKEYLDLVVSSFRDNITGEA